MVADEPAAHLHHPRHHHAPADWRRLQDLFGRRQQHQLSAHTSHHLSAVPLYQQVELLKKNYRAVLIGIVSGVLASLCSVLILALIFHFDHASYVTFLPKSITTAIGIGVSEELGGHVSVSVVVIIVTGVLGNIFAEKFLKLLSIKEPIAKGIAIGCSAHALGTAKAMEMAHRGSHEQSEHRGLRCADGCRIIYLCSVYVEADTIIFPFFRFYRYETEKGIFVYNGCRDGDERPACQLCRR